METLTASEMVAEELNARYLGLSELQLMENAGAHVAWQVSSRFSPMDRRVVIFSGPGGNGGDGFVAARHLAQLGFRVESILVGNPEDMKREAVRLNWRTLRLMRKSIRSLIAQDSKALPAIHGDIIIDALLGIGATKPLRHPILDAVKLINDSKAFKIAVDIPTGIHADTGEVLGEAVKADLTITFHRAKPGLLKASEYVGELIVANVGIPPEASLYSGPGDVLLAMKTRPPRAHKGDFGRLLVIGGSETYSGAPGLVALAALRAGCDLAFVAAPREAALTVSGFSPDIISIKLPGDHLTVEGAEALKPFLEKTTALAFGPGLGLHEETRKAVETIFRWIEAFRLPTVLDADALKAYASFKHRTSFPLVLTPHEGEYRILTGEGLPEGLEERIDHVSKTASSLNAVILLKGAIDIITDGRRTKLNLTGNPGMTVGGTGDVLTGLLGALLAQGFDAYRSAVAAAFINGTAGDLVAKDKGYHLLASDLLNRIPEAFELCRNQRVEELRALTLDGKDALTLVSP
jgi:hydroxyethylthiazole kinase-like uncharacterized protein yjeF